MKAAARRVALQEITREGARLGRMIDVAPLDAILEMVREAAGNVAAYRLAVEGLGIHVGTDGVAVPENMTDSGSRDPALEHVLVAMYDSERDRLVRYSKLAIDAGVDIKKVELAEAQAGLVADAVQAAVKAAGVSDEGRRVALEAAASVLRGGQE